MAQAEAFETDFWKDANLRKVWDDIVPGEPRKTIPYTLTREAIELYCKSVGEDHPIYFDEAYAKTTPLWRADRAAVDPHPLDVFLHAGRRLDAQPGHRQCRAILELQYSGAAGRRHHAEARALDKFIKRERLFVVHDNVFFNQHGEVICSGRGWTIRPQ